MCCNYVFSETFVCVCFVHGFDAVVVVVVVIASVMWCVIFLMLFFSGSFIHFACRVDFFSHHNAESQEDHCTHTRTHGYLSRCTKRPYFTFFYYLMDGRSRASVQGWTGVRISAISRMVCCCFCCHSLSDALLDIFQRFIDLLLILNGVDRYMKHVNRFIFTKNRLHDRGLAVIVTEKLYTAFTYLVTAKIQLTSSKCSKSLALAIRIAVMANVSATKSCMNLKRAHFSA